MKTGKQTVITMGTSCDGYCSGKCHNPTCEGRASRTRLAPLRLPFADWVTWSKSAPTAGLRVTLFDRPPIHHTKDGDRVAYYLFPKAARVTRHCADWYTDDEVLHELLALQWPGLTFSFPEAP